MLRLRSCIRTNIVRQFSAGSSLDFNDKLVSIPIVGRPNVGKSTLFNRLCAGGPKHHRRSPAIVSPFAGTTRDRRESPARISGASFIAIDTGGLEDESIKNAVNGRLNKTITSQVAQAVSQSKVAIFMLDAREGVTPIDEHFALWARKQPNGKDRKWIILLNKAEAIMSRSDDGDDGDMAELSNQVRSLGLGENMMFISAQNGDGFGSLASLLLPYIEGDRQKENNNELTDSFVDHSSTMSQIEDDLEDDVEKKSTIRLKDSDLKFKNFDDYIKMDDSNEEENDDNDEDFDFNFDEKDLDEEDDETVLEEERLGVRTKWENNKVQHEVIELAIVGRPNVGKSSLVNAILQQDRVCVGPMPGVTRDSVPVDWEYHGRKLRLVDTAGIRKFHVDKSLDPKMSPWSKSSGVQQEMELMNQEAVLKLEQQSIAASLKSLGLASVVVMVLDGSVGEMRRIELSLASKIMAEGRALVIAANKGDLIENTTLSMYRAGVVKQAKILLPQHGDVPVVAMSALTGEGVKRLLPAVVDAHDRWSQRMTTGVLNRWLLHVQKHHPPKSRTNASGSRSATKLKFITQLKGRPPTFVIFVNNTAGIRGDFVSYLKNNLRDEFGYHGLPMRIMFRSTSKKLKTRLGEQSDSNRNSSSFTSVKNNSKDHDSSSSSSSLLTKNVTVHVSSTKPSSSSSSSSYATMKTNTSFTGLKASPNSSTVSSHQVSGSSIKNKYVSKKKKIAAMRKTLRGEQIK